THPDFNLRLTLQAAARVVTMRPRTRPDGGPAFLNGPVRADERYQCFATLLRDIIGNPFRPVALDPSWLTPVVQAVAQVIYDERQFADLPVLADALEDAGCDNRDLLDHCREPGEHVRGCWSVDLVVRGVLTVGAERG